MNLLRKRPLALLKWLESYFKENKAAPTQEEMALGLGITGSGVRGLLRILRDKRFVVMSPNHRGIALSSLAERLEFFLSNVNAVYLNDRLCEAGVTKVDGKLSAWFECDDKPIADFFLEDVTAATLSDDAKSYLIELSGSATQLRIEALYLSIHSRIDGN